MKKRYGDLFLVAILFLVVLLNLSSLGYSSSCYSSCEDDVTCLENCLVLCDQDAQSISVDIPAANLSRAIGDGLGTWHDVIVIDELYSDCENSTIHYSNYGSVRADLVPTWYTIRLLVNNVEVDSHSVLGNYEIYYRNIDLNWQGLFPKNSTVKLQTAISAGTSDPGHSGSVSYNNPIIINGSYSQNLNYCEVSNGGVEICDGIDNDCDGIIDCHTGNICQASGLCAQLPIYDEFLGGSTTNFSTKTDLTSVSNVILEKSGSKIKWSNPLNTVGKDLNSNIDIGSDFVSVNSEGIDASFNSQANIIFTNVDCADQAIYYSTGSYTSGDGIRALNQVCTTGTTPSCTINSCSGTILNFTVSGFTGYALGSNANLTIYDGYENSYQDCLANTCVYANYTNRTSGAMITGATCNVTFSGTTYDMIWNGITYENCDKTFNSEGVYSYDVICSHSNYNTLSANDDVNVSQCGSGANGNLNVTMLLSSSTPNQNEVFTATVNVTCINGNCSDVAIVLDPIQVLSIPYSLLITLFGATILGIFMFKRKRSQTATEYMVLVAIVIVVAIIIASILGGFPGLGGSTGRNVDDYKLTTQKVAVDRYRCTDDNSTYLVRNNHFNSLDVYEIIAENINCTGPDFPFRLKIGQTKEITCNNINCGNLGGSTGTRLLSTPSISILWGDLETGARYSTISNNVAEGSSPSNKFILTTVPGTPFYISSGLDNYSCGMLFEDESCNYTFTVNATGDLGDYYFYAISTSNATSAESEHEIVTIS